MSQKSNIVLVALTILCTGILHSCASTIVASENNPGSNSQGAYSAPSTENVSPAATQTSSGKQNGQTPTQTEIKNYNLQNSEKSDIILK